MMDYDGDGKQEILTAGAVLASGCQTIPGYQNPVCDDNLEINGVRVN